MLKYVYSGKLRQPCWHRQPVVAWLILSGLLLLGGLVASCASSAQPTPRPRPAVTPAPVRLTRTPIPTASPTSSPVPPTGTPLPTPTPRFQPACFDLAYSSGQADLSGTKVVFITGGNAVDVFDLLEAQEYVVVVSPVKRANYFASPFEPVIYGDWVAWLEQYSPQEARIYAFNLETEEERAISSPDTHPGYPAIYGDKLAWVSWYQGKSQVMIHNLQTGVNQVIETEGVKPNSVKVWDDLLVYGAGREEGDSIGIVVQQLRTGEKKWIVTSSSGQDVLRVREDKILYEDLEDFDWHREKVCVYDLSTDEVECLVVEGVVTSFDIWDNLITWSEQIDGIWQVHLHSLQTGATTQITYAPNGASSPCINDQYLVWFQRSQLDYANILQVCYLVLDDVQDWLD